MIRKFKHYNRPYSGPASAATKRIEANGHHLARAVFTADEIAALRAEVESVFERHPPDWRAGSPTLEHAQMFRYEMFNRSALCQKAIGHKTSDSTVYNLLHRNGWRKLMPRPFHPKRDVAAQNAFKKTAFLMQ